MVRVRVQSVGPRKIETIKLVRQLLGCGLKEAKDLVESAPFILPVEPEPAAEEVAARFRDLGIAVDVLDGADHGHGPAAPDGSGPFQVVVDGIGDRKIQVIKAIREITQLGLRDAKDLADRGTFHIERQLDREAAEQAAAKLVAAGAAARVASVGSGRQSAEVPSETPQPKPPPKVGPIPY